MVPKENPQALSLLPIFSRSRAGTHASTTVHPELLRLAAPQLRPLRPKCSPLKSSCRQAPPAARVEQNRTTLLRSGAWFNTK
ncbi:MAG: hypothetical protein WC902_10880 [Bacteroidales bacterium]